MNREEQIKAIYEKIADKTLSFGCKIYNPDGGLELKIYIDEKGLYHGIDNEGDQILFDNKIDDRRWIIIGHPVMIGDVLDYCSKNNLSLKLNKWLNFRESIEKQDDLCINYIYNLIK